MVSVENSCFLIGVLLAVVRLSCGAKVSAVQCTGGGTECNGITNSACEMTSHKCRCSTDYKEDLSDGSTCVKVVSATDCTGTSPCSGITNSVCSSKKCKCADGFAEKVNTCVKSEGGNSARSVVQSAGWIFMSLVVIVFQKLF